MTKTVMFIDDDEAFLMAMRRICKKIPRIDTVLEASDGANGLQTLEQRLVAQEPPPDVVFVDINMPVLDGFGFLRGFCDLRARYPQLECVKPVAMLTSSDQERDKTKALELGADEFLVKGMRLHELLDAVTAHI